MHRPTAALEPLLRQFAKETPKHFPQDWKHLHVVGLNEDFVKQLGGTLYLLFGSVALLLLIGCGNVSILLLARATARQHEFAVRSAIGASQSRIVRQLLTESLLLSLTGAGLGLLLAYKTIAVIVANLPEFSFPHEAAIQINVPVLIFSILVAVDYRDSVWAVAGLAALPARSQPDHAIEYPQDDWRCEGAQNALNPDWRPDRAHAANDGRRGRGD